MSPIFYFIIAVPLIFVIILLIYNIKRIKKSRDEAINKKNNFNK
ncbi:hypothetical protein [Clostridium sp. Ade.TY]|nr:hypothetical protein [Clostridium sp. Ade.TY]